MKIERPDMILSIKSTEDLFTDLWEELGHNLNFMYTFPQMTGRHVARKLPTPIDSVEVEHVDDLNELGDFLGRVGPEWTKGGVLWYNNWSDGEVYANVARAHSSKGVIVPCTGTEIVPHVPEWAVIGYDNNYVRGSTFPQIPTEQLVGRKVCIIGGGISKQFTKFCELTIQGVDVVAAIWGTEWHVLPKKAKRLDINLEEKLDPNMELSARIIEGVKNALAWWDLGTVRINRFMETDPK